MGRLRAGRPGAIGAEAQAQEQPQTRRGQRQEDRREFGMGGSAERYKMREKLVSFGDDFWIENEQGQRKFKVDGKMLRVRDTLIFEDTSGHELVHIQTRLVSVRDRMKIERKGGVSAVLLKDLVNVVRDDFILKFDNGEEVKLTGNILDHEYSFVKGRDKIGEVSKKWFRIADSYGVQLEPGSDDIMLLAATVALDQMTHEPGK
jgi:uncharacterized protein YxjI